MKNAADRVISLRKGLHLSQQEFAERIGVSRGYLSHIEARLREPGPDFIEKLESLERSREAASLRDDYASYDSNVLPSKTGRKGAHANVSADVVQVRTVPVLSMIQAGQATDFSDLPVDEFTDNVAYEGRDQAAFALRIEGDSMEPKFSPGMIITVNPSIAPRNGQLVAAKIKEEGVLFKMFHHSGDGKTVTLTSYNPLYPALTYPREKFHWIYPVVAAIQRF